MTLTHKQYILLIDMVNASIERAASSGIPIHPDYYNDIDTIKHKIIEDLATVKNEEVLS